jgi:hypothetical protein
MHGQIRRRGLQHAFRRNACHLSACRRIACPGRQSLRPLDCRGLGYRGRVCFLRWVRVWDRGRSRRWKRCWGLWRAAYCWSQARRRERQAVSSQPRLPRTEQELRADFAGLKLCDRERMFARDRLRWPKGLIEQPRLPKAREEDDQTEKACMHPIKRGTGIRTDVLDSVPVCWTTC